MTVTVVRFDDGYVDIDWALETAYAVLRSLPGEYETAEVDEMVDWLREGDFRDGETVEIEHLATEWRDYQALAEEVSSQMAERISVAEAARALGMSTASLRQAARKGRLDATREGDGVRATYYTTMDAVERYLDSRPDWIKRREAAKDK